jgi:uncharacterized delta-60 repeat protein
VTARTNTRRDTRFAWAAVVGCLGLLAVSSPASAQPGALDSAFGGDGKVTTDVTGGFDYAVGLVVQGDGKLVAAGPASGGGGRFALVRYAADGMLDDTFSGDGVALTNFTSGFDGCYDLAIQTDGKLVAVGETASTGRFALARYNVDGSLDPSFGGDGKVTTNFSRSADFAFGVAIQTDQKIVVTGRAGGSGGRVAVARYNPNGSLDTSFSGDGKATTDFTAGDDRADSVAIQADGAIVVAGTADYFRRSARVAVARYTTNGTPDNTFSGNGKVMTNLTSRFDGAFALAIQPGDQKIVVAGQSRRNVGVVRYNRNGTLDSTFSGDGQATTSFTTGLDYADDVALDAGGKIVLAGSADYFGPSRFALARYDTDGTLDTTFSGDGKLTTNFTPGWDGAFDLEIQAADGNIVAAGGAGNRGAKFALARYLAN